MRKDETRDLILAHASSPLSDAMSIGRLTPCRICLRTYASVFSGFSQSTAAALAANVTLIRQHWQSISTASPIDRNTAGCSQIGHVVRIIIRPSLAFPPFQIAIFGRLDGHFPYLCACLSKSPPAGLLLICISLECTPTFFQNSGTRWPLLALSK